MKQEARLSRSLYRADLRPDGWKLLWSESGFLMPLDLRTGDVLLPLREEPGCDWCLRVVRIERSQYGLLRLTYQQGVITPRGQWVSANKPRFRARRWMLQEALRPDAVVLRREANR